MISADAYGRLVVGHVLADAAVFQKHGITFWVEEHPVSARQVPLVDGMRILGMAQGERLVQDSIATLMYFDSNGDPYLDANDPLFAGLLLFTDADKDGRIDSGEVRALSSSVEWVSKFGAVEGKSR